LNPDEDLSGVVPQDLGPVKMTFEGTMLKEGFLADGTHLIKEGDELKIQPKGGETMVLSQKEGANHEFFLALTFPDKAEAQGLTQLFDSTGKAIQVLDQSSGLTLDLDVTAEVSAWTLQDGDRWENLTMDDENQILEGTLIKANGEQRIVQGGTLTEVTSSNGNRFTLNPNGELTGVVLKDGSVFVPAAADAPWTGYYLDSEGKVFKDEMPSPPVLRLVKTSGESAIKELFYHDLNGSQFYGLQGTEGNFITPTRQVSSQGTLSEFLYLQDADGKLTAIISVDMQTGAVQKYNNQGEIEQVILADNNSEGLISQL
jgi:hypothetical protein